MVLCLHLFRRDDTLYDTFFVNNKCRTERTHILAAAHALLTPCAKFLGQFMFRISNQRKGKLVFLNKLLVRLLVVDAYTYHFCMPERCNPRSCLSDRNKAPLYALCNRSNVFLSRFGPRPINREPCRLQSFL